MADIEISRAEYSELMRYQCLMNLCRQGVSGHIQRLSYNQYGKPDPPRTFHFDPSHASDRDLIEWARSCVQSASPCEDHRADFSPTGPNSLYGVIVPELARRLKELACDEFDERARANVPYTLGGL